MIKSIGFSDSKETEKIEGTKGKKAKEKCFCRSKKKDKWIKGTQIVCTKNLSYNFFDNFNYTNHL